MFPSESLPQNNEQPPFKGIGKFGAAAQQPETPVFNGSAALDSADEPALTETAEISDDVVSRGLRFHNILKGVE